MLTLLGTYRESALEAAGLAHLEYLGPPQLDLWTDAVSALCNGVSLLHGEAHSLEKKKREGFSRMCGIGRAWSQFDELEFRGPISAGTATAHQFLTSQSGDFESCQLCTAGNSFL